MITIDKTSYRGQYNERIRFLVLHFTAGGYESSLSRLLGDEVSVHYLVSELQKYFADTSAV